MPLNRKFWNPILVLSGGMTLASGIFLLFRHSSHLIAVAHQVGAILFVVACAMHIAINLKSLLKSINSRLGWAMLAILALFVLAMVFSNTDGGHQHQQRGFGRGWR
ncbi:MAG: hypothetical protein FWG12_07095 [Holophagaceae bacterium]|nr:hypothetical protein [Holophagaceae bacterium]